jgi:hypothetical protein
MLTKGSGVVQLAGGAGDGVDVIPGGTHPPLMHMPWPIAANGSGVWQLLNGSVIRGIGGSKPNGSQPPSTHAPPPTAANGSDSEHAPKDVGGGIPGASHPPL